MFKGTVVFGNIIKLESGNTGIFLVDLYLSLSQIILNRVYSINSLIFNVRKEFIHGTRKNI